MNPFSPNYRTQVPEAQLAEGAKATKISAIRTKQRKAGMSSDDPQLRKAAAGTLPGAPLSKRGGRKA